MTDQTKSHLTTSQALAAYDNRQRAKATAAGAPTDRTACAGLILSGSLGSVVFTAADGKVRHLDLTDPEATPRLLDFAALRGLMTDAYDLADTAVNVHRTTIFADRDTLRRATKMAASWAKSMTTKEARSLSRLMEFRGVLPTSTFTPVLADALATRYWLPTGPATDDVAAWDAAFGHGHPHASAAAFSYLIGRALDGNDPDEKIGSALSKAEKYGARAGQYGSDHSACSAFSQAGTVTDAYAAMLAIDPTLRERNAMSGAVAKVRIHQIKANQIEAYVDDPGKLREGSKVILFDGFQAGSQVEVTLKSVEFVNDALMAVFSPPSAQSGHGYIVEAAKKNYKPLYVTAAPFLMIKRSPKNRRWTDSGEEKNLRPDIPVDIALAGAPSAA